VLDIVRSLIMTSQARLNDKVDRDEDWEIGERIYKLKQVKSVLERGGHFRGINRKVQVKPLEFAARNDGIKKVTKILFIVKWGGELTKTGKQQAGILGSDFRHSLYPQEDGLLSLHSTYRHDLKIYASDEGRVQMTAAAFAKSFLDLDGELTPILVSLVRKDHILLDNNKRKRRFLAVSSLTRKELNRSTPLISE